MAVSNVDGQVKGAVGGDVVVQASDVIKEGGVLARDDGRDALKSSLRCDRYNTHEVRPFDVKNAPLISLVKGLKTAQILLCDRR